MSCYDNFLESVAEGVESLFEKTCTLIGDGVKLSLRATKYVFDNLLNSIRAMKEKQAIKRSQENEEIVSRLERVLALQTLNYRNTEKAHKTKVFSEDTTAEELELIIESIVETVKTDSALGLDEFFDPKLIEGVQTLLSADIYDLTGDEYKNILKVAAELSDKLELSEEEGRAIIHAVRGEEFNPSEVDDLTLPDVQEAMRRLLTLIEVFEDSQGCAHHLRDIDLDAVKVEQGVDIDVQEREQPIRHEPIIKRKIKE